MGYTHYFKQTKTCPPEAWEKIRDALLRLQTTALINNDPLLIQADDDLPGAPYSTDDEIVFNGIGDDGHETMVLERVSPHNDPYPFCKTARKPYDRVVVALLCLADYFAPGVWLISSDGDEEDWAEGLALARTVEPNCPLVTFKH